MGPESIDATPRGDGTARGLGEMRGERGERGDWPEGTGADVAAAIDAETVEAVCRAGGRAECEVLAATGAVVAVAARPAGRIFITAVGVVLLTAEEPLMVATAKARFFVVPLLTSPLPSDRSRGAALPGITSGGGAGIAGSLRPGEVIEAEDAGEGVTAKGGGATKLGIGGRAAVRGARVVANRVSAFARLLCCWCSRSEFETLHAKWTVAPAAAAGAFAQVETSAAAAAAAAVPGT
jgi:hypothetical protein